MFNFTQSTVVNKTQIWLRSWLLCWRRQSDVGSDASSTCLAVLLFCCSAVWLFCCFADVMNRTELCSYTFDICEGVKLVRRPRVCRPTRLIYLYFFFFPFSDFLCLPLFVCLLVCWLAGRLFCVLARRLSFEPVPLALPFMCAFFFIFFFSPHFQWGCVTASPVGRGGGGGGRQADCRQTVPLLLLLQRPHR